MNMRGRIARLETKLGVGGTHCRCRDQSSVELVHLRDGDPDPPPPEPCAVCGRTKKQIIIRECAEGRPVARPEHRAGERPGMPA